MTKVAGQAASYSPSFCGVLASLSMTVSGQVIGAGMLAASVALSGSASSAQSIPSQCTVSPDPLAAGGTVTCVAPAPEVIDGIETTDDDITINIGDADTPTTVNSPTGDGVNQSGADAQTLNIINSGSSVTGAVNGVVIEVTSGAGDLTLTSEGSISGAEEGILATNNGTGDLSIFTTGSVTGENQNGINANNGASADDLVIESMGPVSGYIDGIVATNTGTGALIVTATGDVTAETDNALEIEGYGTDLSITTSGTITGDDEGIFASNYGTGTTTIVATGDIIAIGADGIDVVNDVTATNLDVQTSGTISADNEGIEAENDGTGALTIVATNTITTTLGDGIQAINEGTDLSIVTEGIIAGGEDGIAATNNGTGALTITATGDVTGAGDGTAINNGIFALNASTATDLSIVTTGTLTGRDTAIYANNTGTGALTFTATGDVDGTLVDGIYAINDSTGTDLSITTGGTVTGGENGIEARNNGTGALTITATGDVAGLDGSGLIARNASQEALTIDVANVSGGANPDSIGIDASNTMGSAGDITITSSGTVSGTDIGIFARQNGTGSLNLSVRDVSSQNSYGIDVENTAISTGDITITGTGTIQGGDDDDDGLAAVTAGSGDLNIDVLNVSGDDGIEAGAFSSSSGDVNINSRGVVSGEVVGIRAFQQGSGDLTVDVQDVDGFVGLDANGRNTAGDFSITTRGTVSGQGDAVAVSNWGIGSDASVSVNNATSQDARGIDAINGTGTGDLSISTTGTIQGASDGIRARQNGSGALRITTQSDVSGGAYGIYAENEGTNLSITTSGAVTSGGGGIRANNTGTGALAITATGDVEGVIFAVGAQNSDNSTDLSIVTEGDVTGTYAGIYALNSGSGALTVTATGDVDAVDPSGVGVEARNSANGTDVLIATQGDVAGISSTNYGSGALTITAEGAVTSQTGFGVFAANAGTDLSIRTDGSVSGGVDGLYAYHNGTGALTITSTGAISGDENGIEARSTASATELSITTRGTVSGGENGIVAQNSGSGNLTITASQTVSGAVSGIDATSDGGGVLSIDVSDSVTGGSEFGIATQTGAGGLSRISARNGAVVSSASGNAISNDDGDSETLVTTGASVTGTIELGGGEDNLLFDGGSFSNVTLFDGGDDFDTLSFLNSSGTLSGSSIQNFESVVVGQGSIVSFDDSSVTTDRVTIAAGGQVNVLGNFTFDTALLANAGTLSTQNGVASDRTLVAGNFSGGGDLSIDADFSAGTADTLIIDGDVVGAATRVEVVNISTDALSDNEILIVDVGGDVNEDGFVLANNTASAGIFDLDLAFRSNQFFLSSGGINGTGATYEATPSILLNGFSDLAPLRQRTATRQWLNAQGGEDVSRGLAFLPSLVDTQPRQGAWVQLRGGNQNVRPTSSTSNQSYDSTTFGIQAGVDVFALDGNNGQWVFGATAQFGTLNADVSNQSGSGNVDATGYGIGATATWYGNSGTYVDVQGQINWIETDISSSSGATLASGERSTAYAASVEVGHRIPVSSRGSLIPQAQLVFGSISGDTFTDDAGNVVDPGTNNSLIGRLGLAYEYAFSNIAKGQDARAYAVFNVLQDFSGTQDVRVGDTTLSSRNDRTSAEIGIGGVYSLENNVSLFAEGTYRSSLSGSDNSSASLTAGVQLRW